jgi:hypothetical protein
MSNYNSHAMTEFRAAGWVDENGKYCDEMQQAICEHVLKLLEVFDGEGHSGTSAGYAVHLFEKLAMFQPIFPLTGEDWEWNDVSEYGGSAKYQNKRCSRVFKDNDGRTYDIEGKVFWEWWVDEDGEKRKSHYTCSDSHIDIEFPYTPTREYVYRGREDEINS